MASVANGRQGQCNYSPVEIPCLLDCIKARLPVSGVDWKDAANLHGVAFAVRTVESIRRKMNELQRLKIPTGDPNMPPTVRQAKRIKCNAHAKVDIGN